MDEEHETVRTSRQVPVWSGKGVVDGGEALLSVQHDVLGVAVLVETVNLFARERLEVFLLPLPQQQATDVVIEENRPHQVADVPRLPFKFTLKVGNHEAPFLEASYKGSQADVIGL